MTQEQKELLTEQANKLQEVIDTLRYEFPNDFEDEINFLSVVSKNLKSN